MAEKLWRTLMRLWRRLWTRVILIASLGLVAVMASRLAGGLVPEELARALGSEALPKLLDIISTSMLTVTTFSLAAMVTVYRSSSQQFTPRMQRILMTDRPTQTALATFIGAYIFALAAIVHTAQPSFQEEDRGTLYLATLLVMTLIVIEMLRWMVHLQSVGSLLSLTARIEKDGLAALADRAGPPWTRIGRLDPAAARGREIPARRCAYVQEINPDDLLDLAEKENLRIHMLVAPGDFVDQGEPIARIVGCTDEIEARFRKVLRLGALRTAEQDPRFAIIELSELGSKALSPGINDPGTAIDVVTRISRILWMGWPLPAPAASARVTAPVLTAEGLLVDGFETIARDGAKLAEVQICLQERLAGLARSGDPRMARAAREAADRAMARAMEALSSDFDRARVRAAAIRE